MNRTHNHNHNRIAICLALLCWATGGKSEAADPVKLKVGGEGGAIVRTVANQTLIGFSNTRVFYPLAKQNAVVVVHLADKGKGFATSGKVHVFAKSATSDDLDKWINNQHSDALFADIPEPVATHVVPPDAIKTVSSKLLGQEKGGPEGVTYDKFLVEFVVSEAELTKTLQLAAFKDSATAFSKVSAE
ncbi:MAG: hypothetical protein KDB14_17030 [Planctomycetales bacterium]|nr:hypothetical protein [Planctomycetales bacterium]